MKFIIVPAEKCEALCGTRRYAPEPTTDREAKLDTKDRAMWGLYAMPLKDGRRAIPADVLDHPAYAGVRAELGAYPVEDLVETAFDLPILDIGIGK